MMRRLKSIIYPAALWLYRQIGTLLAGRREDCVSDPSVVVLGFHKEILGIGETARQFQHVLAGAGKRSRALELGFDMRLHGETGPGMQGVPLLISHVNPVELLALYMRHARSWMRRCPHVGYWVWELETTPENWRHADRLVDAVWTPSAFSADALRRGLRPDLPIRVLPPPIFATRPTALAWPCEEALDGRVRVLAICDLRSSATRKNPFGAIEAFERMQPHARSRAHLVIKVVGADRETALFEQLQARILATPGISLLEARLNDGEMLGLIEGCDIALSLHRSEGFGLLAAHAAYLGRAVVATAWSAPTEFLVPEGAQLVSYRRVAVSDPQKIYPAGQMWAEPDLDDAAGKLEALISDASLRKQLGEVASRVATERLGPENWWKTYEGLLAELAQPSR